MATDQQFCLRWNNHQSTLISVFDSLLENGTLVDCTLAAEGQYLKAHKVVLSACSPYLETLLSQHYEKHPIVILKDVKFTELKSMMDYMYRGEVNISQDQLGTFLKAAESLQIKGLSDNGDEAASVPTTTKRQETSSRPAVTEVRNVESKRPAPPTELSDVSRDGSISPSSLRKRRRTRRSSQDDADLDSSTVCDFQNQPSLPVPNATIVPTPVQNLPKQIVKQEPNLSRLDNNLNSTIAPESGLLKEKIEPPSEPLLEPKTEYLDYMNNDNSIEVEDLTLDDDEELDSSMDASRPGPSHGDLSNQGYQWPMGDQSGTDEIFMAAQQAVGAATGQQRDSQDGGHGEYKDEVIDLETINVKIEKDENSENCENPYQKKCIDPLGENTEPELAAAESNDIGQIFTIYNDFVAGDKEIIVPDFLDGSSESSTKHHNSICEGQRNHIRVVPIKKLESKKLISERPLRKICPKPIEPTSVSDVVPKEAEQGEHVSENSQISVHPLAPSTTQNVPSFILLSKPHTITAPYSFSYASPSTTRCNEQLQNHLGLQIQTSSVPNNSNQFAQTSLSNQPQYTFATSQFLNKRIESSAVILPQNVANQLSPAFQAPNIISTLQPQIRSQLDANSISLSSPPRCTRAQSQVMPMRHYRGRGRGRPRVQPKTQSVLPKILPKPDQSTTTPNFQMVQTMRESQEFIINSVNHTSN